MSEKGSRIAGFYKLSGAERVRVLAERCGLDADDVATLLASGALPRDIAERMIENAVGTLEIPVGIGLNFLINGRDYLVPMAIEEPSVVAAVSFAAKIVREAGGFVAEADRQVMLGQVQVTAYGDLDAAITCIRDSREDLLVLANSFHPTLVARGGGAFDIEIRVLDAPEGDSGEKLLVLQLLVDTQDAMGANIVNTMAEGVAAMVEQRTGGKVFLRILSNLADRRLARASCKIPFGLLEDFGQSGERIAYGVWQASRFAEADPYRAATHNKGIMNGVDAVALATGNDWRAIEAGAHAFAARDGRYRPLSTWRMEDGHLHGRLELPLQVGTVGGPIRVHPTARLGLKILGNPGARELSTVIAAVGLAQNFAAVRALGSVGIQKGHMAMHARCVAVTAGARGELVERVARRMVESGTIRVEAAKVFLAELVAQG
ncbi:MAG: hydroxymethylglutaryl-CoA reductase, degradative [Deltaproteobacteria bacterium]|nr:hydroxymethylglutaryl-CoA reductase, degradative [Deltaproteobacteria bacterium]